MSKPPATNQDVNEQIADVNKQAAKDLKPTSEDALASVSKFSSRLNSLSSEKMNKSSDPASAQQPKPRRKKDKPGARLFPEKLHDVLANEENCPVVDQSIRWDQHGRSFRVVNVKLFEENILTKLFKSTKMKSFVRQLNLYKFIRISKGRDQGSYYHELFLRGCPSLCRKIRRDKIDEDAENRDDIKYIPDFYSYPPINEETSAINSTRLMKITSDKPTGIYHNSNLQEVMKMKPRVALDGHKAFAGDLAATGLSYDPSGSLVRLPPHSIGLPQQTPTYVQRSDGLFVALDGHRLNQAPRLIETYNNNLLPGRLTTAVHGRHLDASVLNLSNQDQYYVLANNSLPVRNVQVAQVSQPRTIMQRNQYHNQVLLQQGLALKNVPTFIHQPTADHTLIPQSSLAFNDGRVENYLPPRTIQVQPIVTENLQLQRTVGRQGGAPCLGVACRNRNCPCQGKFSVKQPLSSGKLKLVNQSISGQQIL